MIDGKICTRSINAISFICYANSQQVEIVENETGLRLFCVEATDINKDLYNKYKNAVHGNGDKIFVDLIKFTKVLRYLKNLSKNYKNERVD